MYLVAEGEQHASRLAKVSVPRFLRVNVGLEVATRRRRAVQRKFVSSCILMLSNVK